MKKINKIINILGGSLIQDRQGHWRTTRFDEGDNFGALGDRLRVVAAVYLFRQNPGLSFLASGGKGQLKHISSAPFISSIVKQELIDLDVPAKNIDTEANSNTTYEQLVELAKYLAAKKIRQAGIISNQHHLARIRYMIKTGPKLAALRKLDSLKLLSAEKICLTYRPAEWRAEISRAYASQAMKERIKVERQGIHDLKTGKYKFS